MTLPPPLPPPPPPPPPRSRRFQPPPPPSPSYSHTFQQQQHVQQQQQPSISSSVTSTNVPTLLQYPPPQNDVAATAIVAAVPHQQQQQQPNEFVEEIRNHLDNNSNNAPNHHHHQYQQQPTIPSLAATPQHQQQQQQPPSRKTSSTATATTTLPPSLLPPFPSSLSSSSIRKPPPPLPPPPPAVRQQPSTVSNSSLVATPTTTTSTTSNTLATVSNISTDHTSPAAAYDPTDLAFSLSPPPQVQPQPQPSVPPPLSSATTINATTTTTTAATTATENSFNAKPLPPPRQPRIPPLPPSSSPRQPQLQQQPQQDPNAMHPPSTTITTNKSSLSSTNSITNEVYNGVSNRANFVSSSSSSLRATNTNTTTTAAVFATTIHDGTPPTPRQPPSSLSSITTTTTTTSSTTPPLLNRPGMTSQHQPQQQPASQESQHQHYHRQPPPSPAGLLPINNNNASSYFGQQQPQKFLQPPLPPQSPSPAVNTRTYGQPPPSSPALFSTPYNQSLDRSPIVPTMNRDNVSNNSNNNSYNSRSSISTQHRPPPPPSPLVPSSVVANTVSTNSTTTNTTTSTYNNNDNSYGTVQPHPVPRGPHFPPQTPPVANRSIYHGHPLLPPPTPPPAAANPSLYQYQQQPPPPSFPGHPLPPQTPPVANRSLYQDQQQPPPPLPPSVSSLQPLPPHQQRGQQLPPRYGANSSLSTTTAAVAAAATTLQRQQQPQYPSASHHHHHPPPFAAGGNFQQQQLPPPPTTLAQQQQRQQNQDYHVPPSQQQQQQQVQQQQQIQKPQEQRPKIDPSQIPRPPLFTRPQDGQPLLMYAPKSAILSHQDLTTVKFPPPADSRFVVKDDGNASPHLIRSTLHAIPTNRNVLRQVTSHPNGNTDLFGVVCTPCALSSATTRHRPRSWPPSSSSSLPPQVALFQQQAQHGGNDDPQAIPLCTNASSIIDDDSTNPPRCSHCQAYANPFFGGSEYNSHNMVCNFCQFSVDRSVAERISWFRGAMEFGTVEYPVSGDYITRPSDQQAPVAPPILLYAVDVTCPHVADYGKVLLELGLELAQHYARQELQPQAEVEQQQQQQQQQQQSSHPNSSYARRAAHHHHHHHHTKPATAIPTRPLPRMGICLVSALGVVVLQLPDPNQSNRPSWTVMSDVTEHPFCPIPVSDWTWELTTKPDGQEDEEDGDHWTDRFKRAWEELVVDGLQDWLNQKTVYPDFLKVYQASCGGAAMTMMVDALQETGGRATWISWRRCNFGVGSLRDRERDMKVHECELYTPLQGKHPTRLQPPEQAASEFYQALGQQCAKHQIVMDVILHTNPQLPRSFLDVATLTELCRISTGRLAWITTTASGTKWEETMREELCQNAVSCVGYDAIFKVRCSTGLEVKSFVPSCPGVIVDRGLVVSSPELELASVSPLTSVAVLLEHRVGGLPKQPLRGSTWPSCVYIQTALLYTNMFGQRRLRISTLALRTTSNPADVFRSVDFGAMTSLLLRHTVARLRHEPDEEGRDARRAQARQDLMDRCVDLLMNYRLNTTARSAPLGQLILPEKLQLLPLFVMSLIKSSVLRPSVRPGQSGLIQPDPTGDERALAMSYASMSTPAMAMVLVHANIFPVSKLLDGAGEWQYPAGAEYTQTALHRAAHHPYVQLPASVHPSISCLDEDEIYLMDNGLQIFLHVGRGVKPSVTNELLSSDDDNDDANGDRHRRQHKKTIHASSVLGQQVHRLIWQMRLWSSPAVAIQSQLLRPTWPPVIIVESTGGAGGDHHAGSSGSSSSSSSSLTRWEETKILSLMVDDATGHEKDYVDFLCELHRLIKQKVDRDAK